MNSAGWVPGGKATIVVARTLNSDGALSTAPKVQGAKCARCTAPLTVYVGPIIVTVAGRPVQRDGVTLERCSNRLCPNATPRLAQRSELREPDVSQLDPGKGPTHYARRGPTPHSKNRKGICTRCHALPRVARDVALRHTQLALVAALRLLQSYEPRDPDYAREIASLERELAS